MAGKRVSAAKKRVLRSATKKNVAFVAEKLPELKEPETNSPHPKKAKSDSGVINVQDGALGADLLVTLNFQHIGDVGNDTDDHVDDEIPSTSAGPTRGSGSGLLAKRQSVESATSDSDDYFTEFRKPPTCKRPNRTYRRRFTIEQLIEDWEDTRDSPDDEMGIDLKEAHAPRSHTDSISGCTCGMAEEAKKYKILYESLRNEIENTKPSRSECSGLLNNSEEKKKQAKLAKDNAQLMTQNGKLLDALTSKLLPQPEVPFANIEGDFLDADTLRRLSVEADTDYLFVKFVMMRLWPEGFSGRSVTGRPSNNPCGRSKATTSPSNDDTSILPQHSGSNNAGRSNESARNCETGVDEVAHVPKHALEPEKVKFVMSCLYRRRMFLQDDAHTASVNTKAGKSMMTRVISNSTRK